MMEELLSRDLSQLWSKLHRKRIRSLVRDFLADHKAEPTPHRVVKFLMSRLKSSRETMAAMDSRFAGFMNRYRSAGRRQRPQHLMDFARDLGADARQLRGDRRALNRYLDDEALADRYRRCRGEAERDQLFLLERLGMLGAELPDMRRELVHQLTRWLTPKRGDAVQTSAFEALGKIAAAERFAARAQLFPKKLPGFATNRAADETADVRVRAAALELLTQLEPHAAVHLVINLFRNRRPGDQLFLRHRGLLILGRHNLLSRPIASLAFNDPSPFVRQGLCKVLPGLPLSMAEDFLYCLIFQDSAEEVQGAALCALPQLARSEDGLETARELLVKALEYKLQGFPASVAVSVTLQMVEVAGDTETLIRFNRALEILHDRIEDSSIRREAAWMMERLWCLADPVREQLRVDLADAVAKVSPGKSVRLPAALVNRTDRQSFGRILAVLAQEDFGLDLEEGFTGFRLRRTPTFKFRLWRWWYELTHPAPDKRQGYDHTRGRHSRATLRAPSGIMAETTPARVPGEPLLFPEEGGRRPFLPLPDDALSALDLTQKQGAMRFVTGEGVVTLTPPKSLWKRLRSAFRLSTGFTRLARLRNWRPGDAFAPGAYTEALRKMDFNLTIEPLEKNRTLDPGVTRFFGVAPLLVISEQWVAFRNYLGSFYDNSLRDLAVFIGTAVAAFLTRSIWLYHKVRMARDRIPLVIGGWGTRGKSGTERLKAALFNAMGLRFMSKTTGCEARFLYAQSMGAQHDIPLFRPMGKATIWEQGRLAQLADKMNTEVLLWECMGLNPLFVRVLQHDWMRDDIATITNTHPDHEDLQGPSGLDVAQTISNFIPAGSQLITSEETMLPVLRHKAIQLGTRMRKVGRIQAGLLPRDLLERFPYAEHPYNIALVADMAESLGIEPDFALKEMADRVVPDLGVLKTFVPAPVANRQLSFANGMSANERHGCLSNWRRLGFDGFPLETHPDTVITVVVNNREDRITRSQIFSGILVRDLSFDTMILVGTNLTGMEGYLAEDWESYLSELDPYAPESAPDRMARRLRIPHTARMVQNRLTVMLSSLVDEPTAQSVARHWQTPKQVIAGLAVLDNDRRNVLMRFLEQDLADLHDLKKLEKLMATEQNKTRVTIAYRDLLTRWFKRKIITLRSPHLTGEQMLTAIIERTPFGMHNHIMGLQNIKGPGMELVRAFQEWEPFHHTCEHIRQGDLTARCDGLIKLEELGKPNILAGETVANTLTWCREQNSDQQEDPRIIRLEQTLRNAPQKEDHKSENQGGALKGMLSHLDAFLEAGRAIRRRKKADRIYKDLAAERIGFNRAAAELQALEQQQK
ncbi:MAG: hypothetical protein QNK37_28490 [Acidobacteriota bacterium]|nr:hypothetical protein [Acidobacteriota bacterium]